MLNHTLHLLQQHDFAVEDSGCFTLSSLPSRFTFKKHNITILHWNNINICTVYLWSYVFNLTRILVLVKQRSQAFQNQSSKLGFLRPTLTKQVKPARLLLRFCFKRQRIWYLDCGETQRLKVTQFSLFYMANVIITVMIIIHSGSPKLCDHVCFCINLLYYFVFFFHVDYLICSSFQ